MRIFINAVALKYAGARSVLSNFLNNIAENGYGHTYYIFLPDDKEFKKYSLISHLHLYPIPNRLNRFYFRYFIDHVYLQRKIKEVKPDIIFSMGNIALPITTITQVVLFHNAHPIYPESAFWNRVGYKKFYFRFLSKQIIAKFKYAKFIAAQTDTAKKRLDVLFGLENKTVVIPNAITQLKTTRKDISTSTFAGMLNTKGDKYIFLCLSRYYAHKNLEVLVDVADLIKKNGKKYQIIITIEQSQGKGAAKIIKKIREKGLEEILINIGTVEMVDIPSLYCISDALILPTLLESFSGTYIESAFYNKPVFTSNFDFAVDVLGEAAIYFDPFNPQNISDQLDKIQDTSFISEITAKAYKKVTSLPSWKEVSQKYINLLEKATGQQV